MMRRSKQSYFFTIILLLSISIVPVVHHCHGDGGHSHLHDSTQCDCTCHHAGVFSHDSKNHLLEWLHLAASKWIGPPSDSLHKEMLFSSAFAPRAPPLAT